MRDSMLRNSLAALTFVALSVLSLTSTPAFAKKDQNQEREKPKKEATQKPSSKGENAKMAADTNTNNPVVILKTSKGNIEVELWQKEAPKTVANFLAYVEKGHYNKTIFHRVIPRFMIQGGGFTADMSQKPTDRPIENEAGNKKKNRRGTIAMARTSDPHSASAQFFINTKDNEFLDFTAPTEQGFGYAVFGQVTAGMDVVDQIEKVATSTKGMHQNVPMEPVVIESATLKK